MKPAIRILLVDDQQLLRLGFRMLLETQADLEVVGEAGDGTEALRLVGQTGPDVVLMDVRMPGMDGIQATEQITTQYPQTRVLVLTTFDLDQYAFAALRAGAKPSPTSCLLPTTLPRRPKIPGWPCSPRANARC